MTVVTSAPALTLVTLIVACVSNAMCYLIGYAHRAKAEQVRALHPPTRRRRGARVDATKAEPPAHVMDVYRKANQRGTIYNTAAK